MRTEFQRQTSRLNGAKSHGPRTAAGKQPSSQNACRHGLYSRRILSEEVRQELQLPVHSNPPPEFATPAEAAYHFARRECMHVASLETRVFNTEMERQRSLHSGESPDRLFELAWTHLCRHTGVMEALFRLQSAASRLEDAAFQLKLERRARSLHAEQGFECTPRHSAERCARSTHRGTNPTAPEPVAPSASSAPQPEPNNFRGTNPTAPAPVVSTRRAQGGGRRQRSQNNNETNPTPAVERASPKPMARPSDRVLRCCRPPPARRLTGD